MVHLRILLIDQCGSFSHSGEVRVPIRRCVGGGQVRAVRLRAPVIGDAETNSYRIAALTIEASSGVSSLVILSPHLVIRKMIDLFVVKTAEETWRLVREKEQGDGCRGQS